MKNARCWYFSAVEQIYLNDWLVPIAAPHQSVLTIRYYAIAGLHEECSPATQLPHAVKRGGATPLMRALCGTFVSLGLSGISRKTDAKFLILSFHQQPRAVARPTNYRFTRVIRE
jgi:hypothetical protein